MSMTEARPAPLYIKVHPAGNVAIVANDGCLDAGATFACGLTLVERVPQGHEVALADRHPGGRRCQPLQRHDWLCARCDPRRCVDQRVQAAHALAAASRAKAIQVQGHVGDPG